ncbi:MAG: GMC family oxidoreductase [Nitrospirae bacterium]|nr:GMC family oxidoreductase [Nitrospirota bacterium]
MSGSDFDAIVIGSGAGGGAMAWALSSKKIKVLLLESGPAYDPFKDYLLDKPQWEQTDFPYKANSKGKYSFGQMQELDKRFADFETFNHVLGKLFKTGIRATGTYGHVKGVGGTTLMYSGEAHRMNPEAMKMKSRFQAAADWPFDYKELEPYYCIAEQIVGVAGPTADDAKRYRSKPYPLPPHRPSYGSSKIQAGCRKLGMNFVSNSLGILSAPYDGRPPCNYCGGCNRGCQRTDKGSVDRTFIPKAVATGYCTLRAGCQVTGIEAGDNDRIKSVSYVDSKGNIQQVSGRIVVVSCGAIETPRLLLASSGRHAPDGLCNESGMVGKNFMETLYAITSALHDERLASYRAASADIICWDYNNPDAIKDVIGGCRFSAATAEAGFAGPLNYALRVAKGWGKGHKEQMRQTFGNVISVAAIGEFLPNTKSYIDLDPAAKDASGIPIARINTYNTEMDLMRLRFMMETSRQILFSSGAGKIIEQISTYDSFTSSHVFGTCRMGKDSRDSVLNAYCQSHRWKNLFVVDASVFPSSGGGESPSLTIEALAIRTAGYIAENKST